MQFFGGSLPNVEQAVDNSIRFNFNSFGKAFNTVLDLLTGNLWSEVMIDTAHYTGKQTGIIYYVLWLVLSRWLVVAMLVTVVFYRIDMDTEDYLKIAAKNSMRSVFALEHAFMQVKLQYKREKKQKPVTNATVHFLVMGDRLFFFSVLFALAKVFMGINLPTTLKKQKVFKATAELPSSSHTATSGSQLF